ncbi:NFX1-type zinc finger-containing protein 1 [Eumeta japonica]|uniref:NFX1-type zinc finger-containing protein 1 n=1 Tax=Eumeta variegata TaxID=151549 RepID=A0A4C1UWM0_EUMVA|nr:NFX1-type zinc finger-containing protein 1 [Eumeta japonica]
MECNPDMNVMECWKKFDIAKCIVNIKESLEELKLHTLKSCWKKLWPALTAENDEESVHPQILTANIAEIANGIGRDGFEQIESSDIQELLESQNEDLTETDLEEMLNSQPIEEEASTSTGKVTGVVTKEEVALAVRAVGLPRGHWYRCPNGHLYSIGHCGQANQSSRCPDCGAAIGGVSYRLAAGNRPATELDF